MKCDDDNNCEDASQILQSVEPERYDHDFYHLQENQKHLQQEVSEEDLEGRNAGHNRPIPDSLDAVGDDDGRSEGRPQKEHHSKQRWIGAPLLFDLREKHSGCHKHGVGFVFVAVNCIVELHRDVRQPFCVITVDVDCLLEIDVEVVEFVFYGGSDLSVCERNFSVNFYLKDLFRMLTRHVEPRFDLAELEDFVVGASAVHDALF